MIINLLPVGLLIVVTVTERTDSDTFHQFTEILENLLYSWFM